MVPKGQIRDGDAEMDRARRGRRPPFTFRSPEKPAVPGRGGNLFCYRRLALLGSASGWGAAWPHGSGSDSKKFKRRREKMLVYYYR